MLNPDDDIKSGDDAIKKLIIMMTKMSVQNNDKKVMKMMIKTNYLVYL